ncbi:hypothetical protein [Altererythrobacter sp. Z27]|uniref:hypothetical protein n=1 Tax=Altererythrobacter sp. Z27 TaxID=3461147 RepID=UPI0040446C7C
MRRFIPLAGAWALAACAGLPPAQMRLPADLADNTRVEFQGVSGWTHGRFTVGEYSGGYQRSEERLAFFDTWIKNSGHTEFVVEGPAISTTIEARCRVQEKILDLGSLEFKTKPMSYSCEFTANGRPFPARFELQEVREGLSGALSKEARRGEILLGGEAVQIRSVHRIEGSPFAMASPIGYVFEQDGRPVGAVELNGRPVLILPRGTDQGLARTLTIAALALGLFWDPADSQLGD